MEILAPGGYSWEFLVGVCCPVLYIRLYFRPKNVVFHSRFQTSPLKSIYGHFQTWPRLFNSCMALYPAIGYKSIQWITQLVFLILIRWIAIYPVDIGIQRLNNRGLAFRQKLCYLYLD